MPVPEPGAFGPDASIAGLIPLSSHVSPCVVKTTGGDFLMVWRLDGLPFVGREEWELEHRHGTAIARGAVEDLGVTAEVTGLDEDVPLEVVATNARDARAIIALLPRMGPQRNLVMQPLNCLILGIPNVGKSTLMNTLVGRKVARAANQAAITTKKKRVHLNDEITLYDTPGVLWPKIEDEEASFMLAGSGAVRETAMDNTEVAARVGKYLLREYADLLRTRYKLDELPENEMGLLVEIGKKRGCLVKGGEVDLAKAAGILLNELRAGQIGRISLQKPPAWREG